MALPPFDDALHIRELARDPAAQERIEAPGAGHAALSARYQAYKADNAVPLR